MNASVVSSLDKRALLWIAGLASIASALGLLLSIVKIKEFRVDILSPMVLGAASIVLTSANRNASISDRARACARALLDPSLDGALPGRAENLKSQLGNFDLRFQANCSTIGLSILGLALCVMGGMLWHRGEEVFGTKLCSMGAAMFGLVTLLWIWDSAVLAPRTLKLETEFALTNENSSISVKAIDVLQQFNNLYDEIASAGSRQERARHKVDERQNQTEIGGSELRLMERRFWNLQLDQYEAFLRGMIPFQSYERWMRERRREWDDNRFPYAERSGNYRSSWTRFQRREMTGPDRGRFVEFMGSVLEGRKRVDELLFDALDRNRADFFHVPRPRADGTHARP